MQNNPSEEYNILVNWLIHQHNRRNHHTITFLTINLITMSVVYKYFCLVTILTVEGAYKAIKKVFFS